MEQLTSALHSPSAEPVQLLQEAAKGNADFVRAMLARHPEQVGCLHFVVYTVLMTCG